ncbi:MAG: peroxiredoxin [Geminocystis sp.]|nr:peroxiredoxin [Geminocystis sp.]HIK38741.1 peroxiredoxin [Geminocystis sp. M7585_C2015_104]MCS7148581.1 peroxiredoxin [Geminocystis sp.]MCX8078156.1 peroxiredoxin [Geminocystis sp.]MDW8115027.1 peroxiredoxin [Geminocystis sp.]
MWKRIIGLIFIFSSLLCNPSALALGGVQPALNQPAPDFTLPTNRGNETVSLKDYRGKWVVLYFYPQDFTPGCTIEARKFQEDLEKYHQLNAEVIGVSVDSVASHESFCEEEGLQFPLLSDTDGSVSKAYGSFLAGRSLRHTFIINPEGILVAKFLSVRPIIHSKEVLAKLEELSGKRET